MRLCSRKYLFSPKSGLVVRVSILSAKITKSESERERERKKGGGKN